MANPVYSCPRGHTALLDISLRAVTTAAYMNPQWARFAEFESGNPGIQLSTWHTALPDISLRAVTRPQPACSIYTTPAYMNPTWARLVGFLYPVKGPEICAPS